MKFKEYFNQPEHLLSIPKDTLSIIEDTAEGGVIAIFLPIRRTFFDKRGCQRWLTVYQLADYNIETDEVVKLYKYCNTVKGKDKRGRKISITPEPREADLEGRTYFTDRNFPKPLTRMLQEKIFYFRHGAKRKA